jgi:hypothetical protein
MPTPVLFQEEAVRKFKLYCHLSKRNLSAIRLDTDPTNQRNWNSQTCKEGEEHCVTWELTNTWVNPGLLDGFLLVTAFSAFIFGRLFVGLLGTVV